jgi:hypothetical protein
LICVSQVGKFESRFFRIVRAARAGQQRQGKEDNTSSHHSG